MLSSFLLALRLASTAAAAPILVPTLTSSDVASTLQFVGLLQIQHAQQWLDGAPATGALFLNRARAGVTGTVWQDEVRYLLVADFGRGDVKLLYANLDYTFVPGALSLRVGQFKRPFSRSFLSSSSQLSMIDRPLPVATFGDDADIGLMVHNGDRQPFEYAVGLFGGGEAAFHPVVTARVSFKTGGLKGYTESDLEGGGPRLGVGGAVFVDLEPDAGLPARGVVDLAFKARGFALTSAVYLRVDGATPPDRRLDSIGHHTQVGYVIADRIEPVVRYTFLLDDEVDTHDASAGLNVFLHGHALKLQGNVGVREVLEHPFGVHNDEKTRDVYVETQLSFAL